MGVTAIAAMTAQDWIEPVGRLSIDDALSY